MDTFNAYRIALAILACFRLGELFAFDEGPLRVFERLRFALGANDYDMKGRPESAWGRFISCPYCLGIWFAAFLVVLVVCPTLAGDLALLWLGIAGGQALLQGIGGRNR